MSDQLTDDDFGISASREDSAGNSEQMARVAPVRGGAAIKSIFGPANRKRLIFMGGSGLLLFSAIVWSVASLDEDDAAMAAVGTVERGARVNTREGVGTTELQRQAAEAYNREQLPEVQRSNPNAHPVVVMEPAANPFEGAREVQAPRKVSDVGASTPSQPRRTAAPPQEDKELDALIKGLIEDEGKEPRKLAVAWQYPRRQVQPGAGNQSSAAQQQGGIASQSQNSCDMMVRAGDMFMATTDIALNSDVGGPASLTIRSGALRNYRLIGTFERKEEWVRLEMRRLVGPDKTYDNVQAVGLDVVTTLNAVEGDVDRHLVYRYGWWGFGTVLKAIGRAAEKNVDQQVVVADGSAVQSTQKDSAREIKMAIGSLGDDLGSAFQDRLDRPITVSLRVGDEVGVFFIEDVCR